MPDRVRCVARPTRRPVRIPRGVVEELRRLAPDRVSADEPMARHTSFGLGGPADIFIEPPTASSFRDCVAFLADERIPARVLGRGTNVLVRSGGIDGVTLVAREAFSGITRSGETLVVGSGVSLPKLLSFCAEEGLSGLEGLAGIPGSVGGAVVTNAGSYGVAVADRLVQAVAFEPGRDARSIPAADIGADYRTTGLPESLIIESVTLRLDAGDPAGIAARQRATLERKWRAQPCGMRSAGCVFKNPPGQSAGRLIDSVGLKGTRIGGAVVSDQHANFIVNDRGASADDVEDLIELVRSTIKDETGIELELEVEIVGKRAN
jgi:UDP-N-acetylmuramate dehydrogenase